MFEKAARCYALAMFLACTSFLILVMGAAGTLIGVASGGASLRLLWALTPQSFASRPFESWATGFGMYSGFLGALGGAFLMARLCWSLLKGRDRAEFQALARRTEKLHMLLNRRS